MNKSIFPFDIDILSPLGNHKAKTYKLNSMGMILEVPISSFMPQMQLQMNWTLPFANTLMQTDGIIIKTYNQLRGKKKIYFVEVHFKNLNFNHQQLLQRFLTTYEEHLKAAIKKSTQKKDSES